MQFEEDEARPADEDPEFTGATTDAADDEFLVDDDATLAVDDDLDEPEDDEEDAPAADL